MREKRGRIFPKWDAESSHAAGWGWMILRGFGDSRNDYAIGSGAGEDAEVPKHAGVVGVLLTGCTQRALEVRPENPINLHHLCHCRLAAVPYERAAQFPKNTAYCAVMNVSVGAVDIAEGLFDTVGARFADNPCVPGLVDTYGQAEFKGHVESRRARTVSIQLNPRQIVN